MARPVASDVAPPSLSVVAQPIALQPWHVDGFPAWAKLEPETTITWRGAEPPPRVGTKLQAVSARGVSALVVNGSFLAHRSQGDLREVTHLVLGGGAPLAGEFALVLSEQSAGAEARLRPVVTRPYADFERAIGRLSDGLGARLTTQGFPRLSELLTPETTTIVDVSLPVGRRQLVVFNAPIAASSPRSDESLTVFAAMDSTGTLLDVLDRPRVDGYRLELKYLVDLQGDGVDEFLFLTDHIEGLDELRLGYYLAPSPGVDPGYYSEVVGQQSSGSEPAFLTDLAADVIALKGFVREPAIDGDGVDACAFRGGVGYFCGDNYARERDPVKRRYMRRLSDADARRGLYEHRRTGQMIGVPTVEAAEDCRPGEQCKSAGHEEDGYACLNQAGWSGEAAHRQACRCDWERAQLPLARHHLACDGPGKPVKRGLDLGLELAADILACGECRARVGPAACAREVARLSLSDPDLARFLQKVHVPRCQLP